MKRALRILLLHLMALSAGWRFSSPSTPRNVLLCSKSGLTASDVPAQADGHLYGSLSWSHPNRRAEAPKVNLNLEPPSWPSSAKELAGERSPKTIFSDDIFHPPV
jgi:hypothetical protein